MARIGLYFGSFNPVHIGHIAIAGYMTGFTDLDQVWFVVSPHNPLKRKDTLLADRQRLYMVSLAIGDNDKLKASDIEFSLPAPSYTTDTLAHLTERFPSDTFCLVMGEDNLHTLHKWKNAEELVNRYTIYIYPRRESQGKLPPETERILKKADLRFVKAPLMEISGTFIRDGISDGHDMSYFLPPPVWNYIREMHFYEK